MTCRVGPALFRYTDDVAVVADVAVSSDSADDTAGLVPAAAVESSVAADAAFAVSSDADEIVVREAVKGFRRCNVHILINH